MTTINKNPRKATKPARHRLALWVAVMVLAALVFSTIPVAGKDFDGASSGETAADLLTFAAETTGVDNTIKLKSNIKITNSAPVAVSEPGDLLTIGRDLTLDLNGFTLDISTAGRGYNGIYIATGKTLTVEDSSGGNGELRVILDGTSGSNKNGYGAAINTTGAELSVNSGTVTATSTAGAGIGGGYGTGDGGAGGTVTISGGTVTASSINGAGIGGGSGTTGGGGGTVTISGGTVTATSTNGAGIGCGDGVGGGGAGGTVTITGGRVTATSTVGAGIGGGGVGDGGTGTITGGSMHRTEKRTTQDMSFTSNGTTSVEWVDVTVIDGTGALLGDVEIQPSSTYTAFTDASGTARIWIPTPAGNPVEFSKPGYPTLTEYVNTGAPYSVNARLDSTPPTVTNVTPSGTGAATAGNLVITFDEAMNTTQGTVALSGGGTDTSSGSWSAGDTVFTISYSGLAEGTLYTVTISAFQDAAGNTMTPDPDISHSFTTISEAPVAPTITTSVLPDGRVDVAYSQTLTANGDSPINWSVIGSLPPGLSLNLGTGEISGTPNAYGSYSFNIKATNGTAPDANKQFTIKVNPPNTNNHLVTTAPPANITIPPITDTTTSVNDVRIVFDGNYTDWVGFEANGVSADNFITPVTLSETKNLTIKGVPVAIGKSGSVDITLLGSWLRTLPAGEYSVRVWFADGYGETSFTIAQRTEPAPPANPVGGTANPKTGDDTPIGLMIALIAIVGATLVVRRKVSRQS